MSNEKNSQEEARVKALHLHARQGMSLWAYHLIRAVVKPFVRLWFRFHYEGAEHIPATGPVIIAPNHKSFFDTFFIGVASPRPVRFMAKSELMKGIMGWLFVRLGAFPVERGGSDALAIETAHYLLEQGEVLVIFPEGTRVEDPHALGSPHHGAGRLALDTGAPIVPSAITGTHKLFLGPLVLPRRVQLAFSAAVPPAPVQEKEDAVKELIDEQVWPAVRQNYTRQLARPGLALGTLAALGLGAKLLADRQARAQTRLVGIVEPKKIRRRKKRARLLSRLHLR